MHDRNLTVNGRDVPIWMQHEVVTATMKMVAKVRAVMMNMGITRLRTYINTLSTSFLGRMSPTPPEKESKS